MAALAVHVDPAAVHTDEPADLVQPLGAAADPAAGDEFHLSVVVVRAAAAAAQDLEPDPLDRRVAALVRALAGQRARVPGAAQIVGEAAALGAVARAHQRLGGRCLCSTINKRLAARDQGRTGTAGTGIVFNHGH